MNTKLLSLITSGVLSAGSAIGLTGINALAITSLLSVNSSPAYAQDADEQINVRVYQRASPAVVSVVVGSGTGSGSIISPDGLVLTNAHVVQNTRRTVTVVLGDNRRFPADVIAFGNNGLDLAVLKIRGVTNLPTIRLARTGSIQVGQRAFAIGNPFGQFAGTFTVGIVSRIDRERGLIQTDAAINPGNSGGPLLNGQGELIGVNTAIFTNSRAGGNIGIGFAISVDRLQPFLAAVRAGRAPRVTQRQQPRTANPPQNLAFNGVPVNDRLGPGDNILPVDNSFFKVYRFEGRAGQQVVIEMLSREIDPFLILLGPNRREIAQDDDSAGSKNARIAVTLPMSGTYLLIANSYQAGESGNFILRALAGGAGGRRNRLRVENLILQQEGVLGPGASVLSSDGSFYRMYNFQGRAGQSVTITLESADFDPYLALLGPDGEKLAENNNISPNDPNSAVSVTLPRAGIYRAIVNTYQPGGRGRYLLTIR
ncbi:trypsin-like peptidase domain-containing protein [Argonema antarcticum]|uniref:trypsin-like peptidase domain-containing protein n=1 Tax=Argonema antarcticum TaxID=2942763 RepID=UPI002012B0FB|nr:trypsin-like peptidase domain-containing protein [Argonema antarcticum]MCL1470920.1 trypsin-like peptidase domain-containing protein [Argonema antarcticum A004/B2]